MVLDNVSKTSETLINTRRVPDSRGIELVESLGSNSPTCNLS